MQCHCGLTMERSLTRPDIRICPHCDRVCLTRECPLGRKLAEANGSGPMTRPGRR